MAEMKVSMDGVEVVNGAFPVTGTMTPSGTQDVAIVSPATVPVSGTVTALPSGTQAVSGTVTSVPSGTQNVAITSPVTFPVSGTIIATPSGTQVVSGTVSSVVTKDPALTGVYAFSADEIVGVAAANNYVSLFNPLLSGKTYVFFGAFLSAVTAGGSVTTSPMRAFRANTVAAGTLQLATAITRFSNLYPVQTAEVRTGNPTAVLDGGLFNSPPPLSAGNGTTPVHAAGFPPGTGPFLLAPGEGIVFRQAVGDTDLRWNIGIAWGEM